MAGLSEEEIRHALTVAKDRGFQIVKLRDGQETFQAILPEFEISADEDEEPFGDELEEIGLATTEKPITAPVVGFYRPGKGFEVGAKFESGQSVAEIVSLGLANDVKAPLSGEVVSIELETNSPVEYGQVIGWMKP